jgi:uncharacterized membrane protein (UPF0127 family)
MPHPGPMADMNPTKTLGASLLALLAGAALAQGQPQDLPKIAIQAGMHVIQAQVAQTPEQMMTGLMYRSEMPQQEGMLFVYPRADGHCFWMKNTLLPLSIAFIADDGTIVNIADMQPQTLDSHCAARPVRYALEMNQGWFAKRGIKAGFKLTGAPFGAR